MFRDRTDAGERLARATAHLRGPGVVVVGLPRGGVPVALPVAQHLGAPLDVVLVRRLGVPWQPEVAMGAIGEDGVRVINDDVVRMARVTPAQLAAVEAHEQAELATSVGTLRRGRPRVPLAGRTVIVVDDGVATGSTARAACIVARAEGAARVVLAVPVGPPDVVRRFAGVADEVICVETPRRFTSIGQWYADFGQVHGNEVAECLRSCGRLRAMVLEIAVFTVKLGHEDAFVAAYGEARELIASSPGCRSARLTRGVEHPDRFTLLVEWETLEDHLDGFRGSDRFTRWRALIGPHFDTAEVVHVTEVQDLPG